MPTRSDGGKNLALMSLFLSSSNILSLASWILIVLLRSSISESRITILVFALSNSCRKKDISASCGVRARMLCLAFVLFFGLVEVGGTGTEVD